MASASRSSGSETRIRTKVIGVRADAELDAVLRARAVEAGIGHCELARRILEQHLVGAAPAPRARPGLAVSDADRTMLATFSRHAGRLTGALIQAAKAGRAWGTTQSQREALEILRVEVKEAKQAIDRVLVEIAR